MLHKVNPAPCEEQFAWVVELQKHLLTQLCQPGLTGQMVDKNWVRASLAGKQLSDRWISSLPDQKDRITKSRKPLLDHMRVIASLSSQQKQDLLDAFEHDSEFYAAYQAKTRPPDCFRWPTLGRTPNVEMAIRGFFESFYAPLFYDDGYSIVVDTGLTILFNYSSYVQKFKDANPRVQVCSYCDGPLTVIRVDHIYPKSRFPFYSCQSSNLIPICETCNGLQHKADKTPLDVSEPDPLENWFHPYLNPFVEWAERSKWPSPTAFYIDFDDQADPFLVGESGTVLEKRLKNLDNLVHLAERWQNQKSLVLHRMRNRIYGHKQRGRIRTKEELREKIEDAYIGTERDIGTVPFAILEYFYAQVAVNMNTTVFEDLWQYALEVDQALASVL